jgi:hypothetical protein
VTNRFFSNPLATATACFIAAILHAAANAEDTSTARNSDSAAVDSSTEADATLIRKYAEALTYWAGSTDNALALLNGLHEAKAVTLTQPATKTSSGATTVSRVNVSIGTVTAASHATTADIATTFAAPTGLMSLSDTVIALAIAQKALAVLRISSPTPAQIQAVLTGGSVTVARGARNNLGKPAANITTQLPGILTLRASGMSWGKVAQRSGVNLEPVLAAFKRNLSANWTASIGYKNESRCIDSALTRSADTTTGATLTLAY